MRFRLTFNLNGKQRMLPIDYQYYLSAWIYKVIGKADREFSRFLHSVGYSEGNRKFKLFCYSPLYFERYILWKDRQIFEINSNILTMAVSFQMPEAAGHFIAGLFRNQEVYVGDRFNGIDLTVAQVEGLPESVPEGTVRYRSISPVVISCHFEGERYSRYLSPSDKGYGEMVIKNLVQKAKAVPGMMELTQNISFSMESGSVPKSKLVTIKPFTGEESRVRGYLYGFSLTGPPEIHKLIRSAGFGEKNSMGFGWVEMMRK